MIWILAIITVISWVAAVYLIHRSRERFAAGLAIATRKFLNAQRDLDKANSEILVLNSRLTPPAPRAQDAPKRYSGAQLRRMADQVNITAPELTNSEILQEQANG